jgi:DNA-binding NtrC family response regulator
MRTLLIVDDDEILAQSLQRQFKNLLKDFEILIAIGATQGLEILHERSVDVVISDMQMSFMDGIEFLKTVQTLAPHTIRLILSGERKENILPEESKPFHGYFVKPCNTAQIANFIHTILK